MPDKPFRLSVRALVLDDQGRCLLIRRSSACHHFVGQWEWPGGKLDEGETFDVGMQREVREETGLEIELTGVAGAFGFEMAKIRMVALCMEAKAVGGALRLSEEHDAYRWVPLADMLQLDLVPGFKEFAATYAAAHTGEGK